MKNTKAIFPGSFDPITVGHIDVIKSSLLLFKNITIAIGVNKQKKCMFDIEDRINMIESIFEQESRIVIKKYTYIFTTGVIGPTHDDVTSIAIAKAFKVNLVKNTKALKILKKFYSSNMLPLNEAREKMALIPKGAELLHNPITKAAGFRMMNVYVMAGIPEIMEAMFKNIIKKIKCGTPEVSRTILFNIPESNIADCLSKVQKKFIEVEIGSYPFMKKEKRGVNVVLRSKEKDKLKKAEIEIKKMIKEL